MYISFIYCENSYFKGKVAIYNISPTAQGLFISNPAAPTPESVPSFTLEACPAELTESARPSKGTRSQRGRLSARWVAAMQRWQRLPEEAPLGGRCLSPGGKGRCR